MAPCLAPRAPLQAVNLIRSIDLFSTRPVVVVAWAPWWLDHRWRSSRWVVRDSWDIHSLLYMAMDQYLYIPFLGGWTSINPSYFDVNYRGTRFWHTAIFDLFVWWCMVVFSCGIWWYFHAFSLIKLWAPQSTEISFEQRDSVIAVSMLTCLRWHQRERVLRIISKADTWEGLNHYK